MIKPNPKQAFLIGYLYGSSFENDEKVEIWCRTELFKKELSDFLNDNGIIFIERHEDFREMIVIESYKSMKGFLHVFGINEKIFYKDNVKKSPHWFVFSNTIENGDIDMLCSFLLGIFESSGFIEVEHGIPSVSMHISNLDESMALNIYNFYRLYGERKIQSKMTKDFFSIGKRTIAGVEYYLLIILPILFKEAACECSVIEWSRIHLQLTS